MTPFVIFAAPNPRAFALSRFFSFGGYECAYQQAQRLRSIDDVRAWLSQDFTGTCETHAAPWWRLLPVFRPDARVLVVQGEEATPKLAQISRRLPEALQVSYAELETIEGRKKAFEHCLPHPYPLCRQIEQILPNERAIERYVSAHARQIQRMAALAQQETVTRMTAGRSANADGMTFQQEPFDEWFRDAQGLFNQHMVATGQCPGDQHAKNLPLLRALSRFGALQITTARSNGRMFGYLMTILAPSLDSPNVKSSENLAFFASPDAPGLGLKLQRASLEALRARGVQEVFMRAGIRGSGPKMGALYRRLGAEDFGHLYRLKMGTS